jgi:hypothetical protein
MKMGEEAGSMSSTAGAISRRELLLTWVLLTMAGYFISMSLRRELVNLLFFWFGGGIPANIMEGCLLGVAIGLAQLLALPANFRPQPICFVGASLVGWALGWGFGWRIASLFGPNYAALAIVGALAGLATGLGQWPLLRRSLRQAGWWIPANSCGWALALPLGASLAGLLAWPASGAIAGLITGLTLLQLWPTSQVKALLCG